MKLENEHSKNALDIGRLCFNHVELSRKINKEMQPSTSKCMKLTFPYAILVLTRWYTPKEGNREETGLFGKVEVSSETFVGEIPREL